MPNRLISNRTASHNSPYQLLAFLLSSLQPLPARPSVHPEFSLLRQAAVRRRLALASQAVHISLLWAGLQAVFVEGRPSQDASTRQIRDCSSVSQGTNSKLTRRLSGPSSIHAEWGIRSYGSRPPASRLLSTAITDQPASDIPVGGREMEIRAWTYVYCHRTGQRFERLFRAHSVDGVGNNPS